MDAGRDGGQRHEGLDIAEAAAALGITTAAVRKRIKRRSLTAIKVNGRYVVCLDGLNGHRPARRPSSRTGHGQSVESERDGTDRTPDDDPSRALIDALQAEVTFLRRELEARTDELRRRDSIIMALATRPPALPATVDASPDTGSARPVPPSNPRVVPRRRRRPLWERLFAAVRGP